MQTSEDESTSKQIVEHILHRPVLEEEASHLMMEKESGTPEDSSTTQIMEGVLGDLELKRLEIIDAPCEDEKETNNLATKEVPQNGVHEEHVKKVVEEEDEKDEEMDEVQQFTPLTIEACLSAPTLETGQDSSLASSCSSSYHYPHFRQRKSTTPQPLTEVPTSSQLDH